MSKRLTNEEFLKRVRAVHGEKYDFSKIDYKGCKTKVCVICPEHGEYLVFPSVLLCGGECNKCAYEKKTQKNTLSTDEFIKRASSIHGGKYDYTKSNYISARIKVCITCPEHGEFWQNPFDHLSGKGCYKCAKKRRDASKKTLKTTEEFINECVDKYGDIYDYSKVKYINAHTKVCIIDKQSTNEIYITPTKLLTYGVPNRKYACTKDEFIEKAKKVHGEKYDYSKVEYVNTKTKVCIICPKHGEFWQTPSNHLKFGCNECGFDTSSSKSKLSNDEFIEKAKAVHGDRYDYSKVKYINNHEKVCIVCPKHGEFWQAPSKHLSGQGCPICKNSWLEREVLNELKNNGVNYIFQYSPDFLKNGKGRQKLDYFLPDYNIAIECQGIQHFIAVNLQSKSQLKKNQELDIRKKNKCEDNNIRILYYIPKDNIKYIRNCEIYNEQNSFDDINKLFKAIIE